ncbi:MAG: hypothetical protein QW596_01600 [Sulfolobales archaeon]
MDGKSLIHVIMEEAIEMYNRTHGTEAQAKLIELRGDDIALVEFTGTFCASCGVVDWVEDLAYIVKSMGYEAELIEYLEPEGPESAYKRFGVFKLYIT